MIFFFFPAVGIAFVQWKYSLLLKYPVFRLRGLLILDALWNFSV